MPAHWMDSSKVRPHWALTCSGMQLARQRNSRADTGGVIVTEVTDSDLGSLRLEVL